MSNGLLQYVSPEQAAQALASLGQEFAIIQNWPHVFPAYDVVPLKPRQTQMKRGISAVFLDMDGTTTLTEDLCLLALEEMVRRITNRMDKAAWAGLDHARDYPHIIGSSSSKNVEYLFSVYGTEIDEEAFAAAFVRAAARMLAEKPEAGRLTDIRIDLAALGIPDLEHAPPIAALPMHAPTHSAEESPAIKTLIADFAHKVLLNSVGNRMRAALDIYFERLNGMFTRIRLGKSREVAAELYGDGRAHAIRPLPGVGVLHALAKGWLSGDPQGLAELLIGPLELSTATAAARLDTLIKAFNAKPAKVALVTSSGREEADTILHEVFDGLRDEVASWPVAEAVRARVLDGFADHRTFYDTIVTATDSHEIRLKPYRDLYTVALHNLDIAAEDADRVLGFEDTEAGIVGQRAAGVGVCCAVPFEGSRGHDFRAASHVLHHGIPEAILTHGLFLNP